MTDPIIFLFKRIIFRNAYKLGKELGKELREAPKILRNPPSYDRLSNTQKIFAGTREDYEKQRRKLLSKRISNNMKYILLYIAEIAERIEKDEITESEYHDALRHLRQKSKSLSKWENDFIYEIIDDNF